MAGDLVEQRLILVPILRWLRLAPFLGGLVKRLVVLIESLDQPIVPAGRVIALVRELRLQPLHHRAQRTGDREAARRQQLPQHQRDELPLSRRQGVQRRPPQVLGHQLPQRLLVLRRREGLDQRDAAGVGDIGLHLTAQRARADVLQSAAQPGEGLGLVEVAELVAKARQIAEHPLVDQADQPVQLQQRVLQRRGREQHLLHRAQRLLQRAADDVVRSPGVAQPVGFVQHRQIPAHPLEFIGLALGELVGADDRAGSLEEGLRVALGALRLVAVAVENQGLDAELLQQLLMPLLAQVGRHDDQDVPAPLGPALRDHQAGLDRLAQPHLVGQDHALRQRVAEGEQRGLDLMRVQIDLRIHQRGGQQICGLTAPAHSTRKLPCDVLAVVGGQLRYRMSGECCEL